jgi:hypothetical protein
MKPVNNKSLLHFLFDQMEKLDKKEITTDEAKAQGALAKQVNNCMKYELDRSRLMMDLDQHRRQTGETIDFRNVEGKNFD